MEFDIKKRGNKENLELFAEEIMRISEKIGMKSSARGWCYLMEVEGFITKDEFDRVENLINSCRKRGILPIDFISEEGKRDFKGVEKPDEDSPIESMRRWITYAMRSEDMYTPNWWKGEEYYIQMIVEKIDLKTLFSDVCEEYHIPIATSSGWSSMLQRAIYARRFKEAEEKGLKPVLLYCGDHDPDGLRISEFLKKNLEDLQGISWDDGETGFNPCNLEIVRFGLNYDFIEKHKFTWIDNLITGSKKGLDLSSPTHRNHNMFYVQDYIKNIGKRKCEANVLMTVPKLASKLVRDTIIDFLGEDALDRFQERTDEVQKIVNDFREKTGLTESLQSALDLLDESDNK